MTSTAALPAAGRKIRQRALAYPGAHEDMPWGHHAIKVKGKTFVFLGVENGEFSLSVKLPSSGGVALNLPFASPTGYGLGRSGWITARFKAKQAIPVDILLMWLDESFRAIAPKRLAAQLDLPGAAARTTARKKKVKSR
jgi:predicted DNA-binding protein (MmcQ/YjbR family)